MSYTFRIENQLNETALSLSSSEDGQVRVYATHVCNSAGFSLTAEQAKSMGLEIFTALATGKEYDTDITNEDIVNGDSFFGFVLGEWEHSTVYVAGPTSTGAVEVQMYLDQTREFALALITLANILNG